MAENMDSVPQFSLCTCCSQKRGWWTLCVGELLLRFRTSIVSGLTEKAVNVLRGSNRSPVNWPESTVSRNIVIDLLGYDYDALSMAWFSISLTAAIALATTLGRLHQKNRLLTVATGELLSLCVPLISSAAALHWFQRLQIDLLTSQLNQHLRLEPAIKVVAEGLGNTELETHDPRTLRVPMERETDIQVLRDGRLTTITWEEVVPGDVVQVQVISQASILRTALQRRLSNVLAAGEFVGDGRRAHRTGCMRREAAEWGGGIGKDRREGVGGRHSEAVQSSRLSPIITPPPSPSSLPTHPPCPSRGSVPRRASLSEPRDSPPLSQGPAGRTTRIAPDSLRGASFSPSPVAGRGAWPETAAARIG